MNRKFSIIKISPNPELGDAISVGLIAHNELDGKINIAIDYNWIKKSKSLLGESYKMALRSLKELEQLVNFSGGFIRSDYSSNIFNKDIKEQSKTFLNYLNMYNNGIIQFSKPLPITGKDFQDLISLLKNILPMGKEKHELCEVNRNKSILNFDITLHQPLREIVHTDVKINNEVSKEFFFEININVLGLNGKLVAAKYIDFTAGTNIVRKNISNYDTAISLINKSYKLESSKMFIIGDEPNDVKSTQHEIWAAVKSNPDYFETVYTQDLDPILNYVKKNNCHKFLENIN